MGEEEIESKKSLIIIYDTVKEYFNRQLITIDSIDSKAATVIGFSSLTVGVFLGEGISDTLSNFLIFSSALLIIAIFLALGAYMPKKYAVPPNLEALSRKYLDKDEKNTMEALTANYIEAVTFNTKVLREKNILIISSFWVLAIGICLIAYRALLIWHGNF